MGLLLAGLSIRLWTFIRQMADTKLQGVISRLTVGGSSLVTAIGGMISFVAWGIALALAIMGASKEGLIVSIVVGVLSGLAVVYDCGTRIIAAESKLQRECNKEELAQLLLRLQRRIVEIEGMSAQDYAKQIEIKDNDIFDQRTETVLSMVKKKVFAYCGPTNGALLIAFPQTPPVSVPANHPWKTLEVPRQEMIAFLHQISSNLRSILERIDQPRSDIR